MSSAWDRATYLVTPDATSHLPPRCRASTFDALVDRAGSGREPVAYIIGRREFWGLDFRSPRPSSFPGPKPSSSSRPRSRGCATDTRRWTIADVGTGSGCLAVTLAHRAARRPASPPPTSRATALAVAREQRRAPWRRAIACTSSETRCSTTRRARSISIVANPPYVPRVAPPTLSPDVRDHEPAVSALRPRR